MRTTTGRTTIFIIALLAAGAAGLVGCSNSSGPSGEVDEGYLEPTSPENVLVNLTRAYQERNIEELLACLSGDFKFHFAEDDQQDWPLLPPWFYRSDEEQVHENMFGHEWDVESISLTLMVASVETMGTVSGGDPCIPLGYVVIITAETDLRINVSDMSYLATSPQDFYFKAVPDSGEREGSVLWEMFEWHDLGCEGKDNGRVEASWGRIKYCFLESLSEPSRRTSPDEVIDQLRAAYIFMDLEDYLDCLSEDFEFYPSDADVQDPVQDIPPVWYKSDERTMHENMFGESSNVEYISLTLTTTDVDHDTGVDPEDPLDDIYVHTEDVDLRVNLCDLTFLVTQPSRFHLRVDQDEEGPYGEIMWEIHEWYDLGDEGRGAVAGRVEDETWGSVKALYR